MSRHKGRPFVIFKLCPARGFLFDPGCELHIDQAVSHILVIDELDSPRRTLNREVQSRTRSMMRLNKDLESETERGPEALGGIPRASGSVDGGWRQPTPRSLNRLLTNEHKDKSVSSAASGHVPDTTTSSFHHSPESILLPSPTFAAHRPVP